ncbi:MAG: flagellar hook basal-body protein [Eubacteriales bacterium]
MNLSFYSAVSGASAQMQHMNVTANNISNVNTYGYKADVAGFANLMYGYFLGAEEEMSYRGAGTMVVEASVNYQQGSLAETGRVFDFAIEGDGFFALYDPQTEEITFTRDGSFVMSDSTLDGEGTIGWRLSDNSGRFVVNADGNFIDIDPAADSLSHTVNSLNIGVFDFVIRDGISRNGPSGFMNIEKNGDIQFGTGSLVQGYLETSNVDLAKEMSKVIEAQRLYSYANKMITTSDEIEQTINSLKG